MSCCHGKHHTLSEKQEATGVLLRGSFLQEASLTPPASPGFPGVPAASGPTWWSWGPWTVHQPVSRQPAWG